MSVPSFGWFCWRGGAIICGSPQADKDVEDMTESDDSIDDWY